MTARRTGQAQQRNYRKHDQAAGQEVRAEKKAMQLALWHGLGEIYRSRLKITARPPRRSRCAQRSSSPTTWARTRSWPSCTMVQGPECYDKAIARVPACSCGARIRSWSTSLQDAAPPLRRAAAVRSGLVRVLDAGLPQAGRRRRDAVLRAVPAKGLARPSPVSPRRSGAATCSTPTRIATSAPSSPPCSRRWRCSSRASTSSST